MKEVSAVFCRFHRLDWIQCHWRCLTAKIHEDVSRFRPRIVYRQERWEDGEFQFSRRKSATLRTSPRERHVYLYIQAVSSRTRVMERGQLFTGYRHNREIARSWKVLHNYRRARLPDIITRRVLHGTGV